MPAQAQIPWSKTTGALPATSSEPEEKPRDKAARNLAEASRQQEAFRVEQGVTRPTENPSVSERRRLLDRLVVAYGEKIKLLDDIENLKRPKPPDPQQQELLAGFGCPGTVPGLARRCPARRAARRAHPHAATGGGRSRARHP